MMKQRLFQRKCQKKNKKLCCFCFVPLRILLGKACVHHTDEQSENQANDEHNFTAGGWTGNMQDNVVLKLKSKSALPLLLQPQPTFPGMVSLTVYRLAAAA